MGQETEDGLQLELGVPRGAAATQQAGTDLPCGTRAR